MKEVPYFELEFAAIYDDTAPFLHRWPVLQHTNARLYFDGRIAVIPVADLEPGSAATVAVQRNIYAEVNIPHRLADAGYTYTFHLFNKFNHQIAVEEILVLKQVIADIHADYHARAEPRGAIEIEEE